MYHYYIKFRFGDQEHITIRYLENREQFDEDLADMEQNQKIDVLAFNFSDIAFSYRGEPEFNIYNIHNVQQQPAEIYPNSPHYYFAFIDRDEAGKIRSTMRFFEIREQFDDHLGQVERNSDVKISEFGYRSTPYKRPGRVLQEAASRY